MEFTNQWEHPSLNMTHKKVMHTMVLRTSRARWSLYFPGPVYRSHNGGVAIPVAAVHLTCLYLSHLPTAIGTLHCFFSHHFSITLLPENCLALPSLRALWKTHWDLESSVMGEEWVLVLSILYHKHFCRFSGNICYWHYKGRKTKINI